MKLYIFFLLLSICGLSRSVMLEKVQYQFSCDPIDVVIVVHKKDVGTLNLAIEGVKQYIKHRNIYIVSERKLTKKAIWFDETQFPFTHKTIAYEIFGNEEEAIAYLQQPKNRIGWIYQQLCKLYALFVMPAVSDNLLVIDADTIFLRHVAFQKVDGVPLFNTGTEYHVPYFKHIDRLIPGLKKVYKDKSGITHHMLFQRPILEDLFTTIRSIHHEEPWKVMCRLIDKNELNGSAMSEYEIYFNFAFTRTDQVRIRELVWSNMSFKYFSHSVRDHDYVSCHSYIS